MKPSSELNALKEKMRALQQGNYDVEADNPKLVRCWERLQCQKHDCPAYGKLRCWSIAGTFCHGEVRGELARKLGDCSACVVYRESCADDVGELVEVFNQMVKDLKYKLTHQDKENHRKSEIQRLSALEDMAAAIAHETRNPLHSIGMVASYLKRNFQGDLATEFVSIIEKEVVRLNDLVSILVGFSHPPPLHVEQCSINDILEAAVRLFRQEAKERNIALVIDLDESLLEVPCDAVRIREALMNLIQNAMDVTTAGDTISIRSERDENHLRISVADTGPGIAEEDRERIFKPFYTTKTQGPGLGLAVTERTIREHGGRVEVESTGNTGTTVVMVLPVVRDIDEAPLL
ncbi:MAG: ATP-binding protein [bacterium]|nr:ATP-binding protein [bacterium]